MAVKDLTLVKANFNAITKITPEAATSATDGFKVKLGKDENTFIVVTNADSSAKNITVKAPTKGSYASTSSDLTLSLNAGETAVIRLESARYANTDGTVILIPGSTNVKVVAVD